MTWPDFWALQRSPTAYSETWVGLRIILCWWEVAQTKSMLNLVDCTAWWACPQETWATWAGGWGLRDTGTCNRHPVSVGSGSASKVGTKKKVTFYCILPGKSNFLFRPDFLGVILKDHTQSRDEKTKLLLYCKHAMKSNFFFRPDFWVYVQQLRPPTTTESLLGCLCVICTCAILPIPGDANIHWWGPKHAQPETQNRGPTTQTNCPRLWEHPEGRGPNEWLLEPRPKVGVGIPSYFLSITLELIHETFSEQQVTNLTRYNSERCP